MKGEDDKELLRAMLILFGNSRLVDSLCECYRKYHSGLVSIGYHLVDLPPSFLHSPASDSLALTCIQGSFTDLP